MLKNKEITQEQLEFALNTQNNVSDSTTMLIQIHKPGRYTIEELKTVIAKKQQKKAEVVKQLTN